MLLRTITVDVRVSQQLFLSVQFSERLASVGIRAQFRCPVNRFNHHRSMVLRGLRRTVNQLSREKFYVDVRRRICSPGSGNHVSGL